MFCVLLRASIDKRAGAKYLQRVARQNHAPPVEAVGHVARRQQKNQARQKQRQSRVAQVDGAMRDRIHLPRHGDRLRLRAQDHGHARQLIPPEVAEGKGLKAAAWLWGSRFHRLLSGYNAARGARHPVAWKRGPQPSKA